MSKKAEISKQGKNWYICIEGCIITVNASSLIELLCSFTGAAGGLHLYYHNPRKENVRKKDYCENTV